jgi:hypothetical protein
MMAVLCKGENIDDMKRVDGELLRTFKAAMRHYGGYARRELDARGLRPLTLVSTVKVIDRRGEG